MNKKYFLHFTWIISLMAVIFAILCAIDKTSLLLALYIYCVAMLIYVLPMSYIGGKYAEIICLKFPNNEGVEEEIKNIILTKTQRKLTMDTIEKKYFEKKNRYSKWLTNKVVLEIKSTQIDLYIPRAYEKYFNTIK